MSESTSALIISSQQAPHKNLAQLVAKYQKSSMRDPIPQHAYDAFAMADDFVAGSDVVLDSGCGVGESSYRLAAQFPNAKVLGLDKSSARLQRSHIHGPRPENLLFLQVDCVPIWRLIAQAQWNIQAHYLFYPNPWPKPGHLQRRWHAHPIFPILVSLGGLLAMRTNWKIYAQEFALALEIILSQQVMVNKLQIKDPFTPFERKYLDSKHSLYEVKQDLQG